MRLRRAYTKAEFEQIVAQTRFGNAKINEDPIGLEIALKKTIGRT
jgi:hypothetical protein